MVNVLELVQRFAFLVMAAEREVAHFVMVRVMYRKVMLALIAHLMIIIITTTIMVIIEEDTITTIMIIIPMDTTQLVLIVMVLDSQGKLYSLW